MSHLDNGSCPGCAEIFNRYPNFNQKLRDWFFAVQNKVHNFHASEAGRGRIAQEKDFARGASKAHYGQSAHNFNCAVDTFFMVNGEYDLDLHLYQQSIAPLITAEIEWYGAPGSPFYERPHFQLKHWRDLVISGQAKLVE